MISRPGTWMEGTSRSNPSTRPGQEPPASGDLSCSRVCQTSAAPHNGCRRMTGDPVGGPPTGRVPTPDLTTPDKTSGAPQDREVGRDATRYQGGYAMTPQEYRSARIADLATWPRAERAEHIIRMIGLEFQAHRAGRAVEPTHQAIYELISDWVEANAMAAVAEKVT